MGIESAMDAIQNRLLPRYLQASSSIAKLSNQGRDLPSATATEELLERQAQLIIHAHNSFLRHDGLDVDRSLLAKRLDDLASIANSKFYCYRHDSVPKFWRNIYTDALILQTHQQLLQSLEEHSRLTEATMDSVVETLDRALIMAGGEGRYLSPRWIEETMSCLDSCWRESRQKEDSSMEQGTLDPEDSQLPLTEPFGRPILSERGECERHKDWTLQKFEDYMNADGNPEPVVFTDLIADWPALNDCPWRSKSYLLSQTIDGRRIVPVEVGRSYVDEGWGQELIPFRDFLQKYIVNNNDNDDDDAEPPTPTGYLAQHDLLRQIPPLRNDLHVPDFCWADVPRHPTDPSMDHPSLDTPQLNAWFGPARTITPLHTDGYHNILCQAVGSKYVRLYPPSATAAMRPRSPEHGVDMSNTSALDVGVMEGWDPVPEDMDEETLRHLRETLEGVEYKECILGPGDALLIPIGWWHYVRSLSISFSVSFWWN